MNFAKRASVMNAFGSFTAKIILVCFSAASFGARIKKARQMFSIFVLVMLLSPATYAQTTLIIDGANRLVGIKELQVGTDRFDVTFESGQYDDAYTANGIAPIFIGSETVANEALLAIFDAINADGRFVDLPQNIGGCSNLDFLECGIMVPFNGPYPTNLPSTPFTVDVWTAFYSVGADGVFSQPLATSGLGLVDTVTWAVFTPSNVSNSGDVVVGDKAWRQLTDTQHLYYDVVVRKCDAVTGTCTGVCSAETGACNGSVGGVDFTGWTWASVSEVGELFATLTPHPGGVAQISGTNTTWAPDFVSRFAPTLYFTESLSFCETRGLENRTLAVQGFTRTTYPLNVNFAHSPRLWDGISSVITDLADTSHPVGKTNDFCGYGIWLYRPAETPPPSEAPTADAGMDQSVRAGTIVQLNGSGSFDDNTPTENLIFDWTFVTVPGATPTLANAGTSTPSFTASSAGTYVIELVVKDQDGQASVPDEVVISSDNNLPPTPDAGPDQLVVVGSTVELSGANSSDPEGDVITFEWFWADYPDFPAPPPPTSGLDTVSPSFIAESEGEYQLLLRVSDFLGPSNAFDLVSVIAVSASDFAQLRIVEANETIGGLPATNVTTQGNQNALGNFLSQAITAIQEGEIAEAVDKLSKAIARTDGCVLRGVPDGNGSGRDWITSCDDQAVLYDSLNAALQALLGQ